MYKKSFLSLMVMLLFVATSCSSEEPAAIEPGGTISGDAGKTLIVYFHGEAIPGQSPIISTIL